MSNHVHLIVVPRQADALAQTLKQRTGESTGHVWQGRFYSCPLDKAHLWVALRYTERNPVRAGLVGKADSWLWSSAAAHCMATGRGLSEMTLVASNAIPRRRYLSLIWGLCTPGIIALLIGIPMGYLDSVGVWRRHPGGPILAFLERIGSGSTLLTLILGPLTTAIALILMILVLRSRDIPRNWKIEAVTLVGLSLAGVIWVLLLASRMWG